MRFDSLTHVILAERDLANPWDGFEEQELFELRFDRCLLTLTEPEGDFPAGHTSWRGLAEGWITRRIDREPDPVVRQRPRTG